MKLHVQSGEWSPIIAQLNQLTADGGGVVPESRGDVVGQRIGHLVVHGDRRSMAEIVLIREQGAQPLGTKLTVCRRSFPQPQYRSSRFDLRNMLEPSR